MAKPTVLFVAFICICFTIVHEASSFSIHKFAARTRQPASTKNIILQSPPQQLSNLNDESSSRIIAVDDTATSANKMDTRDSGIQQSLLAGCITFLTTTPFSAFAETADDLEIAELPPVYVPILFAIGVLGGVGVLTASLGNVMDEGEGLIALFCPE